jgi:DNA-binding response OmpR family regulator
MANSGVLLILDDMVIAQQLDEVLTAKGYYVRIAYDGRRGLSMAMGYPPNLVVLDYYLPDKDGLTLLADMRSTDELENVPIMMVSSSANSDIVTRAIQLRVSDFLIKPFSFEMLLERVMKWLPPVDLNEVVS